jgi:hypothetical protein
MELKIVDRVDQMGSEDRARAAEWFRQAAHELMGKEYAAEILDYVDELMDMADRLSDA